MSPDARRSATAAPVLCTGAACAHRRQAGHAPQRSAAGSRLCRACRDDLARGLATLPGLYEECGRLLGGSDRPRDRTSGGPMPGLPFNSAAADVRSSILGVLGSWTGMLVAQRHLVPPRRTVRVLAEFLGRHLEWLAAADTAADLSDEIARLVRAARRVIQPHRVHRVRIGRCVESGCTGELTALVRPHQHSWAARIVCDTDPVHRWAEEQWMQLSGRLAGSPSGPAPAPRWLTAADISRLWNVPTGSVYRLASERRWRRESRANRTYYHGDDVVHTLSRLAPRD